MVLFADNIINQFALNLVIGSGYGIIGFILIGFFVRFLKKMFKNDNTQNVFKQLGINKAVEEIFLSSIRYYLYFILGLIVLGQFGVNQAVIQLILFVLLFSVLGILLLSLKNIIPNAAAGIYVMSTNLVKAGDKISIGEVSGKVEKINIINTLIKKNKNETIIVPNSFLLKNVIKKK